MSKKKVWTEQAGSETKSFLDMIAPSVVKFNVDHYIFGNTYRCVWALREYPTSTQEQAILRHLGEKNGVTLHIYTRQVSPAEEKRIIHNAANKNRMETANTNDLQQATYRTWQSWWQVCTGTASRSSTAPCTLSLRRQIWMRSSSCKQMC